MITVLVGGVGGAKLALGLSRVLCPGELTVLVNTADDLEWHGLHVSPDVDTILYTLAGIVNPESGWGIRGDTSVVLEGLDKYGLATWFHIGDQDLAVHIARTEWLHQGLRYTTVIERLAMALGVRSRVLPMSDQRVRTVVHTHDGDLAFQEYFVHRQTNIPVKGFSFEGIESATPTPEVLEALRGSEIILLGPSNPFVSIGPILALPGLRAALQQGPAPCVAVSPIVGGKALKGPAGRMLSQLGYASSSVAVAQLYADFLDGYVLDAADAALEPAVQALGIRTRITETVMQTLDDRERVARETVAFARTLGAGSVV
jgi:LPPG:FO 2-phospho-L-lactate transferase